MMHPLPTLSFLRLVVPAALLCAAAAVPAFGQVTLAPTFVYVDSPDRYGTVVITNASDAVQEVFIDFEFGYPAADEDGRRYLEYDDAEAEGRFSLSPWVRSFPERFRIPPKHRHTVRLMIHPPTDLEKGVYWTRMVVTSREQSGGGPSEGTAEVNFEFKQIISVVFDHGAPPTSAAVTDLLFDAKAEHVEFIATVDRTGIVPFFGSIDLRLMDDTGREAAHVSTTAEAYFASSTYFTVDRGDLPDGDYIAEVSLRPERRDVRKGRVPEMELVTRRFRVTIAKRDDLTYESQ